MLEPVEVAVTTLYLSASWTSAGFHACDPEIAISELVIRERKLEYTLARLSCMFCIDECPNSTRKRPLARK